MGGLWGGTAPGEAQSAGGSGPHEGWRSGQKRERCVRPFSVSLFFFLSPFFRPLPLPCSAKPLAAWRPPCPAGRPATCRPRLGRLAGRRPSGRCVNEMTEREGAKALVQQPRRKCAGPHAPPGAALAPVLSPWSDSPPIQGLVLGRAWSTRGAPRAAIVSGRWSKRGARLIALSSPIPLTRSLVPLSLSTHRPPPSSSSSAPVPACGTPRKTACWATLLACRGRCVYFGREKPRFNALNAFRSSACADWLPPRWGGVGGSHWPHPERWTGSGP